MANTSIWDNLDYNRNAVIEASAGTGKTYTLEHIVAKLVREMGYDIRSLLLVTFTEKAAGELKERIRYKSGSIGGVLSYSGYVRPANGKVEDTIVFSVIVNNCLAGYDVLRPMVDKIVALIASEN